MNKKIVVKEIDKLASAVHKGRVITEYLIYVMQTPYEYTAGTPLEAYTEFGENAKNIRVNELILIHFTSEDLLNINKDEIIETVSFEEYTKELKETIEKHGK
jgi:hypothetical protein